MPEYEKYYMQQAFNEAIKAYKIREVPIGAVIVVNDKIIAKAHNNREKKHDVLGHAEIITIKKASKKLKTWKLNDCDLYVTLKPCKMCEEVIKACRINQVFYLIDKPSNKKEYSKTAFNHTNVCNELSSQYTKLLSSFFENKIR